MGMQIYVQKISNPSMEWDVDVEPSDDIEGVKQKIQDKELPSVYDISRIRLFFNGTELENGNTLSFYSIVKFSHLTAIYKVPGRSVLYMS
jgi:hypothetical protein